MKEHLEYFIRSNVKNPDEKEIRKITEVFRPKSFSKGHHFKHHSETCKKLGFLIEGSVRVYVTKENGNEITGRIIQKNNFVTDFIGVRTQQRTPVSIEFLEPASMLVTSIESINQLLEVNFTLNKLIREYMSDSVVELGKLHMMFLTATAKERYNFILENNPGLIQRTPLRFIASMIGITPTQLSRIRKKK